MGVRSEEAFVAEAREWVAAHALPSITIVDSTGLDPANTATATDLIELGRLALADPLVATIVGTDSLTIHDVGLIENTNELLGTNGVTGIKTGTLDPFGANLLFSAVYPIGSSSVTVIGVVLGGTDHDTLNVAITGLLASVQAGFHEVDVSDVGDPFASYSTAWGQSAEAAADAEGDAADLGGHPDHRGGLRRPGPHRGGRRRPSARSSSRPARTPSPCRSCCRPRSPTPVPGGGSRIRASSSSRAG